MIINFVERFLCIIVQRDFHNSQVVIVKIIYYLALCFYSIILNSDLFSIKYF